MCGIRGVNMKCYAEKCEHALQVKKKVYKGLKI